MSLRRLAASLFLVAYLPISFADALPSVHRAQDRLVQTMDPLLDGTGLWQGGWMLFAPDVDKINTRLSANVTFADGEVTHFRSPDWPKLSTSDKFFRFREMEYFDNIRMDDNRKAWPALADYIARTTPHPTGRSVPVQRVELLRHWALIPPPSRGHVLPLRPFNARWRKARFYTWTPAVAP